ncbi:MAG: hypothetical protein GY702_08005 [Desulfobulbaceae bacterium]|nr:hypothetical protein [Desulfobulbaceae bacterium]
MIDLIKKAALTGIGVASLTTEKIEELSKELIVKGKMSEQEGQKFLQEMIRRADESKEALKTQTENLVNSALMKVQFAKSEDIELLKKEVEKLRTEIDSLKKEGVSSVDDE